MITSRLEKRNNSWLVILELGRGADGKRRRLVRSVRGARAQAEKLRLQLLQEYGAGVQIDSNQLTLGEYLQQWLKGREGNIAPRTYESYELHITKHLIPALGHVALGQLHPLDIERYKEAKLKELAPRTVDAQLTTLSQALKKAVQHRLISSNPADVVERPRYKAVKYTVLEPEELDLLLSVAKNYTIFPIVYLAANSGMRLGELVGLEWKHVDLDEKVIHVRQQCQRVPGEGLVMRPPKSKRPRTIPVDDDVIEILLQYKQGDKYVFSPLGTTRHYDPSTVDRAFGRIAVRANKELAKQLGVDKVDTYTSFRIHDLRHTYATHLLLAGVPLTVVQEILGHEQASTTANIYTHTLASRQRLAINALREIRKKELPVSAD